MAQPRTDREYDLEVWQHGICVASVQGYDFERVYADAMHYCLVYGQDGPTELRGIPIDCMDWLKAHLSGKPQP